MQPDTSCDFFYTGPDSKCFPRCFCCGEYSPFLVYLGDNQKSIKFRPYAARTQLFCPGCAPDPGLFGQRFKGEQLFRADSILNDRKFLDLLNKYTYCNPHFEQFSNVDRIIITENTQLVAAYKTVSKRKLPKTIKMNLLMKLFPAAHRLPNQKYPSTGQLFENMQEKYREICASYMDMSEAGGSQLLDNIDFLVNRTPMGERRQVSRKTVPFREVRTNTDPSVAVATDMLNDSDQEMRAFSDSDDEVASIASGGENRYRTNSPNESASTLATDVQISSEEVGGNRSAVPSTQSQSSQSTELNSSVNISSQSVAAHSVVAEITIDDGSDSDDSRPVIHFQPPPRAARRQSPTADDGQQAGPSNVKRRRVIPRGQPPVNPTPDAVLGDPLGRLPRFPGG